MPTWREWKKSGRKKGEPPPEPPAEPVAVRYIVSDCTVEALAVLLEQRPRGLLVARDELSGWVNSFDAYKSCRGADVAHWLSMHRAGPLTVDRKERAAYYPRSKGIRLHRWRRAAQGPGGGPDRKIPARMQPRIR